MNTLKFCFKFSDNSDTIFLDYQVHTYISTVGIQKKDHFFQHSIFLQWRNFFFCITSFFTQKIWSVQQSPGLNSLNCKIDLIFLPRLVISHAHSILKCTDENFVLFFSCVFLSASSGE